MDRVAKLLGYEVASDLHEEWRKNRDYKPRIKKTIDDEYIKKYGTDELDIAATSFEDLPKDWKYENYHGGMVVIEQLLLLVENKKVTEETLIEISSIVHNEWLKRNKWVYDEKIGNPKLVVSYDKLPDEEKFKDDIQLLIASKKMISILTGEITVEELEKKYGLLVDKEIDK